MVGTIIPIGHGERQRGRVPTAHWLHALGSVIGAASLGGLLGALGSVAPWHVVPAVSAVVPLVVTGLVGLLYALRELALVPVPAP